MAAGAAVAVAGRSCAWMTMYCGHSTALCSIVLHCMCDCFVCCVCTSIQCTWGLDYIMLHLGVLRQRSSVIWRESS